MRVASDWTEATIVAMREVTDDVREFHIKPTSGASQYPSGAHLKIRVQLPNGRWDTRHYSLVGAAPHEGTWRIAVKREQPGRGGSRWMHALTHGAIVEIATPSSHFELSPDCPAALLIAGGIGITPLVGMAERLLARGVPVRLIQTARSRAALPYAADLSALLGDYHTTICDDEGARIDFAAAFAALPPQAECYICGPTGMMEAARAVWAAAGRPADRMRLETFGGTGATAQPFTVKLPALNREILVPADASMLDALEQAGIEMLSDCRRGECGLCAVEVLGCDSQIEHRDMFFSAEQRAHGHQICACVSRAAGGSISIDTYWRPAG